MKNEQVEVRLSTWAIIKTIAIFVLVYLVYFIKDIILLFFVVLILAATFRPIVNKWEKKTGRVPAVLILLILALLIVSFIGYIVLPPLITQVAAFIEAAPGFADKFAVLAPYKPLIESSMKSLATNAGGITGGFVNITASVFGGIFAFLTAIVMTIYLLLDKNGFRNFITSVVPVDSQEIVLSLARKMSLKVGDWFRGQMLLSLTVAVIDLIGLAIIGVPYALTLALISGLFDLIPVIGPIIAGTIAALVALSVSPIQAVFVIMLFVVVQQIENTILVPNIMKKAVGLSPVVIILAVLIGAKLLGLVGALLAVPISALIYVTIQEWPAIRSALKRNG